MESFSTSLTPKTSSEKVVKISLIRTAMVLVRTEPNFSCEGFATRTEMIKGREEKEPIKV